MQEIYKHYCNNTFRLTKKQPKCREEREKQNRKAPNKAWSGSEEMKTAVQAESRKAKKAGEEPEGRWVRHIKPSEVLNRTAKFNKVEQ